MSAVADAMMDAADSQPGQGTVPAAIARAARFLVDLKSGKVAGKSEDSIGAATPAAPVRADTVATGRPATDRPTGGRPTADRIAAAHAAAQRALGMATSPAAAPAAPIDTAPGQMAGRQEPRLSMAAANSAPVNSAPANPAPARPAAARPVPVAGQPARRAAPAAARPSVPATAPAKAPAAAPQRPMLSVQQYLRELQFQVSGHNQNEVRQALVEVTPGEIERVTRVVAKLRGRYLAQVLELGQAVHKPVPEGEIKQLRAFRETYEEAAQGLDYLKDAIEKGDIGLNGVIM
jgi:hypothetical protein